MDFLEKDLEQIIYEADRDDLDSRGLYISGKLLRQTRIGNYGTADLISISRCKYNPGVLRVIVYELKKDKIGISAFLQALRYLKGIKRYLEYRNFSFEVEYSIALIGKEVDKNSDFIYLESFLVIEDLSFLILYTYKYNINGIDFNTQCDYKLINEGFNE